MAKTLKEQYDDLRLAKGQRGGAGEDLPLALSQIVLSHGVEIRASDIHIEPSVTGARIRYRIDGLLHEMLQIPQDVRDPLIRALKVRASMATDTVSRSKPQDSRLDMEWSGQKLDLRISSFPTIHGDVLAIRVLNRSSPLRPLDQLGMSPEQLTQFQRLITRPNGLVLVTGPANSGKTTTLYGALNQLRSTHIKIVTLEDPVEYQLDGIGQAQINPAVGLTFATGLRAILRQDANIILVGEIRDSETADIAIRAALTGHLVFSTMHTRHSLGATTRLIDMGIEPHLIVASLNGIVAQRLVRVVCPHCAAPDAIAAKTFERLCAQLKAPPGGGPAGLVKGAGCAACSNTGYYGRVGIFEFLVLTDQVKRMLLDRETTPVYKAMVNAGLLQTMLVDGLTKAARGVTTLDEVLRVTGEGDE